MYSFCFWIGLLTLSTGVFVFWTRIDFIKNGAVTVATVVEQKKYTDSEGSSYSPVFRFYTQSKEEIRIEDNVSTNPPEFSVGEQVKVAYQKDLPGEAVVLTYFGSFGIAVILISIALVLIFISGAHFWAQRFLNQWQVVNKPS